MYYLLSQSVAAGGLYLILRKEVGRVPAGVVGFLAVFLNCYAIAKYHEHLNYSTMHWSLLAIASDFVITARVVAGRTPRLSVLLWRALILVAGLGMDLTYVASVNVLSLVTSTVCCGLVVLIRSAVGKRWDPALRRLPRVWARECGVAPLRCVALVMAMCLVAWLYVPLVLQIAGAATSRHEVAPIDEEVVKADGAALINRVNIWRLVLPYLPGWNPATVKSEQGYWVEGMGGGSVGWTILALGLLGLVSLVMRPGGRAMAAAPALIMLALMLVYLEQCALLKWLPVFHYARVVDRFSMFFPLLILTPALLAPWRRWWRRHRVVRVAVVGMVCLALTEGAVGYRLAHGGRVPPKLDPTLLPFMDRVRNSPGEAVLEWPFCVAGGNGVGTKQLGLYYGRNAQLGFYRRFHEKSVVGLYFGRLRPSVFLPLYQQGWSKMFMPDDKSYFRSRRQRKPFDDQQWAFFESFFRAGDFCGLILCVDLLAPGEEAEFYRRFGSPVSRSTIASVGSVVFIPRSPDLSRGSRAQCQATFLPDGEFHWRLGLKLRKAGMLDAAVVSLARAVASDPSRVAAHNELGIALASRGDYLAATRRFERALSLDPEYRAAADNLRRCRELLGIKP
jgi:hypothetical protein